MNLMDWHYFFNIYNYIENIMNISFAIHYTLCSESQIDVLICDFFAKIFTLRNLERLK